MYLDRLHVFGLPTITNSTTPTVSPYVYDHGAAGIAFGFAMGAAGLWFRIPITADASPTIKIDLVGSDNADLDPNDNESVGNIILASTGVLTKEILGDLSALDSDDSVEKVIPIASQTIAKRYYGLLVTLGGTNPDLVEDLNGAAVVRVGQTNMIGTRNAIPA